MLKYSLYPAFVGTIFARITNQLKTKEVPAYSETPFYNFV